MTQARIEIFFKYSGRAFRTPEGTPPVMLNGLVRMLRYGDEYSIRCCQWENFMLFLLHTMKIQYRRIEN